MNTTTTSSAASQELHAALTAKYPESVVAAAWAAYHSAAASLAESDGGWHGDIWAFCDALKGIA